MTGEVIGAAMGGVVSAAPRTVYVSALPDCVASARLTAHEAMSAARLAAPKGVE